MTDIPSSKLLMMSNDELAAADAANLAQMLKDGLPAEEPKVKTPSLRRIGFGRVGPVHGGLRVTANDMETTHTPGAHVPHGSRQLQQGASASRSNLSCCEDARLWPASGCPSLRGSRSGTCQLNSPASEPIDECASSSEEHADTESFPIVCKGGDLAVAPQVGGVSLRDAEKGLAPSCASMITAVPSHPGEEFLATFKPEPNFNRSHECQDTQAPFGQNSIVHFEDIAEHVEACTPAEKFVFAPGHDWSTLTTGFPIHNVEEPLGRMPCVRQSPAKNDNDQAMAPKPRLGLVASNLVKVVLIGYDIVAVPLLVFELPETTPFRLFSWITSIFWTLDFAVSCLTGGRVSDCYGTQVPRSFRCCPSSWVPFDFGLVLSHWVAHGVCEAGSLSSWSCFAIQSPRLLRLLRLPQLLGRLMQRVTCKPALMAVSMLRILLLAWTLNHLTACAWYGVSRVAEGRVSADSEWEFTSVTTKYAWALRWAPFANVHAAELAGLRTLQECAFVIGTTLVAPAAHLAMLWAALFLAMELHCHVAPTLTIQPERSIRKQMEDALTCPADPRPSPCCIANGAKLQDSLRWPAAYKRSPCCAASVPK